MPIWILMTTSQNKLLDGLNAEQIQAVTHGDGPLLIIAGAGTGKTTVITRRVAWLIEQKLANPNEILALTFTEKAAGEMEERVDRLLPYGYLDLWISTFHAFCQRILESHALEIGLPINFKLLTPTELWVLVRQNFDKFDLDYYRPLGSPSRFIHALVSHFSRAKDELVTPEEYLKYAKEGLLNLDNENESASRLREVANAYAVYQKLLIDNDALDFGDLIHYTYLLFQKRPVVLERYRNQFKYILIDEFQDTNLAQYELIKLLAAPQNNITVVGDDDQSIYKFRGASISNILKFKETYKKAVQVTLTTNYRSYQNLLDLSYKFVQANNPDRLEQKLKISKKLTAQRRGTGIVVFERYKDYHAEAEAVIGKILDLKEGDKESTWNDFAILVRANEAAEVFVDAFDQAGLPYMHLSRRGLYRKKIIVDLVSYFRLLDNYHESRALFRVLNFPLFAFSHEDLAKVLDYGHRKTYSLYETLKHSVIAKELSKEAQESITKFLLFIEKHTRLARHKPVNELFVAVVKDLQMAKGRETAATVNDLNYLDQFFRKVKDFTVSSESKLLRDFMEELEMELSAGEEGRLDFDPEVGPEAVKLITVHSAKGLEFRYVFLVALADKKFPAISRSEPIELPEKLIRDILPAGDFHIQEERRLFYVAQTRARDGLYFSYAQDYGGSSVRKSSVFLKELGLAEEVGHPTGQVTFVPTAVAKTKIAYPLLQSFSFTSISDFRKCPLEYKHRYILKIPEAGKAMFSFGQTIHRTLESFLRLVQQRHQQLQGDLFGRVGKEGNLLDREGSLLAKLPALSKLLKLYEETWVDEWYEDKKQKEDYRKLGKEMLKMLYKKFQQLPPFPKYLEKKFKLGLKDYVFTGKIDRADDGPKGLIIVDYKTGTGKNRPLGKVDKEQLLIYQWAAQDFLREKVAELQYWYLKDGLDIKKFLGNSEQIEEVKEGLLQTIEQIVDAARHDGFEKYHKKHQNCEFEGI